MKNKLITGILGIGVVCSIASALEINENGCKGCHGQEWEKHALGKSKIVADMNSSEITEALLGYKEGTYGGPLAGIMKSQVMKYSEEDIKNYKPHKEK